MKHQKQGLKFPKKMMAIQDRANVLAARVVDGFDHPKGETHPMFLAGMLAGWEYITGLDGIDVSTGYLTAELRLSACEGERFLANCKE